MLFYFITHEYVGLDWSEMEHKLLMTLNSICEKLILML